MDLNQAPNSLRELGTQPRQGAVQNFDSGRFCHILLEGGQWLHLAQGSRRSSSRFSAVVSKDRPGMSQARNIINHRTR